MKTPLACIATALVLTGCKIPDFGFQDDGLGTDFRCSSFGVGNPSSFIACPGGCPVFTDLGEMADRRINSDTTLYARDFVASPPTVTLGVEQTDAGAVTFEGSGTPGVLIRLPASASLDMDVTLTTLLGAQVQDSVTASFTGASDGDARYVGVATTSKPFNRMELSFDEPQPPVEPFLIQVYEFCIDGGPR